MWLNFNSSQVIEKFFMNYINHGKICNKITIEISIYLADKYFLNKVSISIFLIKLNNM